MILNFNMVNTEEAKQMRSGINIRGKLEGFADPRTVNLKTGETTTVRDVSLSDDAGTIKLTLWGDDCSKFQSGDTVELTNGYSNEYQGVVSLGRGKFGQLEKAT